MELQINERKIKLNGVACIPTDLDLSANYDLEIRCAEVRGMNEEPNDDGTKDRVFKLTISQMSEVTIVGKKETIKAEIKKGSQSQALRKVIFVLYEQQSSGEMDFDTFYKMYMSNLIEEVKLKLI